MSLRIGRFFSATTDPSSIVQDGNLLSMSFDIRPGSIEAATLQRQQILGIIDNEDEPVIPVSWDLDSSLSGYYRPISASVEPTQAFLQNRLMRASVALERVKNGYANPAIETYVVSRVATNAHSVVASPNANALAISHPLDSTQVELDRTGLPSATNFRTLASVSGDILNYYGASGSDFEGYSIAYTPVDEYYRNACTIEYRGDENAVIVGRQFPELPVNTVWSLNNGIILVQPTGNFNEVEIGVWDAVSSEFESFNIRAGVLGSGVFLASSQHSIAGASVAPVILRNSPEVCSIRLTNGATEPSFTITIWRGSVVAVITAETETATNTVALGIAPAAAGTNITGGVRTTSNNAAGNRMVLLNRAAGTTSTSDTALRVTTATTRSVFGVALQKGGTGAPTAWTDANLLGQFCTLPQWQQRVAAR